MNIVFLDTHTLGKLGKLDKLQKFGEVKFYPFTKQSETAERIEKAEVVITNKVIVDKASMERAARLKLICIAATGTNNVDIEYAASKNIPVKNAVGYSTKSVAQSTFNSLFFLLHQTQYYDRYVKSGAYCHSEIFTHIHHDFWELAGKTFGIIGLGNIGREVAKIAEAFGANVIYYSASGKNRDQKYQRVDLDILLQESDVVSIHAPLNEKTHNLIGQKELGLMKKHAFLINMGRGGIVKEQTLADAIDHDTIGGAALDVLEKEPIHPKNPLLNVKNKHKLLITPHIAWASIEARTNLIDIVCGHLENLSETTAR